MAQRRTQAERSQATRAALLAAARELFTEYGFAGTGREQIAELAGVTRGALYHHFAGKEQLFVAVVEELEAEVMQHVIDAAMKANSPADELRLGAMAFLDACLDPSVRRILLIEAPVTIDWEQWREIDARHGLAMLTHALNEVMAAGQMPEMPVEPLAHMLHGALHAAALQVATSPKPKAARTEVGRTLGVVLDQLLVTG